MKSMSGASASFRTLWVAILFALSSPSLAWAAAEHAVYALQADGLACPFCAYGIEKQLIRIEGVESVSTEIENGTVIIFMKEGQSLDEADAQRAVENAGFTMRNFEEQVEN